jgi:hypothetical protein
MYKHLFLLAMVAMGLNACGPVYVVQQPAPAPAPISPPPGNPDDVSYQTFYDQLSPYGQWIQDPDYGYVWMPDVTPDFKPYATNGHWVYTDEGWAWDSDYAWGWAAFHYGRWFFRDGYGWMWVPGNDWAPAWVSWRNSDDYYGWAPMEPGISVSVAYSSGYDPPSHYWCFVPHQYIASPQINNYYMRESNNSTIINRTTVINNTTIINHYGNNRYGAGPDPGEVGRFSGAPLRPMPVRESHAPGGDRAAGGGFTVYRPHVNSAPPANDPHIGGNGRPGYAPTNFRPLGNARPVNRTNYGANPTPAPGRNAPGAQPMNAQPTNAQPANGRHANNPPTYNRPPAGQPPMNQGQQGQPNNNGRPSRDVRPAGQPSGQPAGQPSVRPAGQPSVQQPAPAIRRQQPQRPLSSPPAQNANRQRPASGQPTQNSNQPRPIGNRPRPAPPQRKPPPPQKKDDGRTADKP